MANVILVNKEDHEIGQKEKMQAHIDGDLHRAFSIQLYNSKGEVFIHQRALTKYHCGGLWTNACCSHPFPDELTIDGANRRLYEELGYEQIELKEEFVFQYKNKFDNGLTENEIDHVFIGYTDLHPPLIDSEEVGDYTWISVDKLKHDIQKNPAKYSVWFKKIMNHLHA
ncbi:MAG: isopentenyl-diphosphate Delta-isomerase [Spirochaetales bacterium]|nr:isopentenyl-diphosphate Delta-isomerase [Spirochaetales bacterium]